MLSASPGRIASGLTSCAEPVTTMADGASRNDHSARSLRHLDSPTSARERAPDCRVVYIDNDPVAHAHAHAGPGLMSFCLRQRDDVDTIAVKATASTSRQRARYDSGMFSSPR